MTEKGFHSSYTLTEKGVYSSYTQILLEKIADGWMVPAARSNQDRTLRQSLAALAKDLGVSIESPRLAGLFSYQFRENPADPNHAAVSFRAHYTARLQGPAGKPADAAKQYRWVARDRLDEFVTIQALNRELRQILDHPDAVGRRLRAELRRRHARRHRTDRSVLPAARPVRGAAQSRLQRSGMATGRSGAASPPRILSGPPMKANS